jgi:selenide,water dikinase
VLFDPQTSGGLLISVSAARAQDLVKALEARGVEVAAVVGEVIAEPKDRIIVE